MKRWFENSVVYQIYPLSFQDSNQDGFGDLQGIVTRLPYLKKLGINVIWLSPVYQSPMDDNGYDISDYYAINPMFGSLADFKQLLDKAHHMGIKIVMDLVINHTSDQHVWFQEALKGKDNPYRSYYIWSDPVNEDVPSDIESAFTGSAWEYDARSEQYYFHLFSKKQPDLNWNYQPLREAIYEMINWWIDLGIDGFRLDVIDLIGKDISQKITYNGPYLETYLTEMYEQCFKGKDLLTVGETPQISIEQAQVFTHQDKPLLDMVFQFEHCTLDEVKDTDKWHLKELSLSDLKSVFNKWQQGLHQNGWNSLFWSNHDAPRIVSRYHVDERYADKRAKMFATLLHMMEGTPYIYQGEEIGMTNIAFENIEDYRDIETRNIYAEKLKLGWKHEEIMEAIHKKSRDNARTPMQWSRNVYSGFSKVKPWLQVNPNYKKINVENNLANKDSIFYYYQRLIQLRKEHLIITQGEFKLIDKYNEQLFVYTRNYHNERLLVVCNFYEEELTYHLENKEYDLLIHNYDDFNREEKIKLRPYESFVLKYTE